jgi:chorismate mutase
MALVAIRGATTVNSDTPEEIKAAATEMAAEIVKRNNLDIHQDIAMVFLTMTSDLQSYNAAAAIRLGLNWDDLPFFTSQEAYIDGTLPKCIRILIQCNIPKSRSQLKHVYLNEARKLRPDLVEN